MRSRFKPRPYAHAIKHFVSTRGTEVLVLQASPLLGALFAHIGCNWFSVTRLALLLAGSFALIAHVFVFNDWAGRKTDVNDPRRKCD